MKVEVRKEDVLLATGEGTGTWEATFNPNDARDLGWQLVKAADQAVANGRLMEQAEMAKAEEEARYNAEKAKRHALNYTMGTDAAAPISPKPVVALFFAGDVLLDTEVVEGCPATLKRVPIGAYYIYTLDSTQASTLGPGGTTVLVYRLKERI